MGFAVFIVAGYAVALPFFVWMRRDLRRMHPHLWTGFGNPHPWRVTVTSAYLAAGWPALAVALAWRLSPTRRKLMLIRQRSRLRSQVRRDLDTPEVTPTKPLVPPRDDA